jgi:hypothetical protein
VVYRRRRRRADVETRFVFFSSKPMFLSRYLLLVKFLLWKKSLVQKLLCTVCCLVCCVGRAVLILQEEVRVYVQRYHLMVLSIVTDNRKCENHVFGHSRESAHIKRGVVKLVQHKGILKFVCCRWMMIFFVYYEKITRDLSETLWLFDQKSKPPKWREYKNPN